MQVGLPWVAWFLSYETASCLKGFRPSQAAASCGQPFHLRRLQEDGKYGCYKERLLVGVLCAPGVERQDAEVVEFGNGIVGKVQN